MRIGVPNETAAGERRVALVPESCKKLLAAGYEIAIESQAGDAAGFSDAAYRDVGVSVESDRAAFLGLIDLVLMVTAPDPNTIALLRPGTIYVGSLMPLRHLEAVRALAAAKITAFATD